MNEQKSLITQPVEPEYEHLVNNISTLWQEGYNELIKPHNKRRRIKV